MKFNIALCAGILCSLLSGCATERTNITFYSPLISDGTTTIAGSEKHRVIFDNQTTYVFAIDGMPIKGARMSHANKLDIAPGTRKLMVAYTQGSLFGMTQLILDVKQDHNYVVKSLPSAGEDGQMTNTSVPYMFWVEDATSGEVIGDKGFAKINSTGGGYTYIPIYIPKHR